MRLAATMPAPSGVSSLLIDEASLAALVAKAEAGTKITYHIGHLAHDRCPASQVLDAAACRTLSALANRALRFANAGWAHLVQRRLGPDCWAYILVVRSRSRPRPSAHAQARSGCSALQLH